MIVMPPSLLRVELRPLFYLAVGVEAVQAVGGPDGAKRRVGPINAGRFEGERLSGTVLPGGSDWQMVTADDVTHLDARIVLQTDAGELIGMTYAGLRHGPPSVMARLVRAELVDPAEYYFRIGARFSTDAPALTWLNTVIAVGTGHRLPAGPLYNLFEVQ